MSNSRNYALYTQVVGGKGGGKGKKPVTLDRTGKFFSRPPYGGVAPPPLQGPATAGAESPRTGLPRCLGLAFGGPPPWERPSSAGGFCRGLFSAEGFCLGLSSAGGLCCRGSLRGSAEVDAMVTAFQSSSAKEFQSRLDPVRVHCTQRWRWFLRLLLYVWYCMIAL